MAISSANSIKVHVGGRRLYNSRVYTEYKMGLSMQPCGRPTVLTLGPINSPFMLKNIFLQEVELCMNLAIELETPKFFRSSIKVA